MMRCGKHVIRSYMALIYDFSGIRIQDGSLIPVDWKIEISLIVTDRKGKTSEELEYLAGITYQKLHFWLDTNMPHIVMVDVNKEDDLYIANLSSNVMMYCPGNPSDDLIVQLLHSKLSILAGDNLMIGEIKIRGNDTSLQFIFDSPDKKYLMPETTGEYFKEGKARDELPWWSRDDGFCFEFIRPEEIEISEEEYFQDIVDPMSEFEKIMADVANHQCGLSKEPARIVQVEKWKPKTV